MCVYIYTCARQKRKRPSTFYVFILAAQRRIPGGRRRSAYNKFRNMPSKNGGQGVEYSGERWSCSGLDVVTEIYDCGEIGKKRERKKNREKSGQKNSMCGNRSAAAAAGYIHISYIHARTHARTHGRHDYYVNYLIHTNPHTVDNL